MGCPSREVVASSYRIIIITIIVIIIIIIIITINIIRRREGEKVKSEANIGAVEEATPIIAPEAKEAKETAEAAEKASKSADTSVASVGVGEPELAEQGKRRKRKKKKSAEDDSASAEGVAQYDEYKVDIMMIVFNQISLKD